MTLYLLEIRNIDFNDDFARSSHVDGPLPWGRVVERFHTAERSSARAGWSGDMVYRVVEA